MRTCKRVFGHGLYLSIFTSFLNGSYVQYKRIHLYGVAYLSGLVSDAYFLITIRYLFLFTDFASKYCQSA